MNKPELTLPDIGLAYLIVAWTFVAVVYAVLFLG